MPTTACVAGRARNQEFLGSGDSIVARRKLKEIDGRTPQGVECAAQFDSTRGNLPGPYGRETVRQRRRAGCAGSGAWPFATRGVTCQVDSDNA